MKIKITELRHLTFFRCDVGSTFVDLGYWFLKVPFTNIVIHYEKLPF
jgi:hypothetical protein